jgi:hypothetical protein
MGRDRSADKEATMKKWLGVAAGIGLVAVLAGAAFAQMGPGMMGGYPCQGMMGMGWGGQMGPGMMGPGMGGGQMGPGMMGPGMGWGQGQMGPGMMGSSGATQITEEKAKELAEQYANNYLKGFAVDKLLPMTNGMGMTMYSAELKGPQGDLRILNVNPWGGVMPYGGPWRRGG